MKLERISLHLRDGSVRAFDFNPGLTVIEGDTRGSSPLVGALAGALATSGDGIHVEVSLDDGSHLVAFRPRGAPHRVVDTDTAADVTSSFRRREGGVDLLAPWRTPGSAEQEQRTPGSAEQEQRTPGSAEQEQRTLGSAEAAQRLERRLIVTADDLGDGGPTEHWVRRLAQLDPEHVLGTAVEEVAAEGELRRATAAARATPAQAATVGELEEARAGVVTTRRRHNRLRAATIVAGSTLPIGAVVGLNSLGTAGAVGLIGASLVLTTGCLAYERRLAHALEREEHLALAAGGEDYEDVRQQLADSPLTDAEVRSTLMTAAERYQRAALAWQELAGNVPAPWALAQAERIRRSAELRLAVESDGPGHHDELPPEPRAAALIAALTTRVADGQARGAGRQSLPLLLDDPLAGVPWSTKAPVLEMMGRLSAHHQLVLVTAEDDVLSWARLEAMTGSIGAIVSTPTSPTASSATDANVCSHRA